MEDKKVIVCDVDGVLLKWESNLPFFALDNGINPIPILQHYNAPTHIVLTELFSTSNKKIAQEFAYAYNLSAFGRHLTGYPDAIDEIHKLARDYKLVALTSFGSTQQHYSNRMRNLQAFFPNMFSEVICIDYDVDKTEYFAGIESRHGKIEAVIDDQMYNLDNVRRFYNNNTDICIIHLNRHDDSADVKSCADINDYIKNYRQLK
ncbi:hypothetical protein L0B53_12175 [Vibrio sp. SS-MA-C1-2]|uniref:hypothetical protein n=1 Tax=Vibrio sp. SS-MA-C1-2 TaxID=2908646 RepID=UPI001F32DADF|nr:hypothetical protein [Vibrio sp. SS-MA-C1-2]UJF17783.1 hypothetical protein L0B53_12175 [Vibrio sp. SS-MA-C1-2]